MRPQLLGEFRQDGNVSTLSPFGFRNQDHLFFKEHVLYFDVHKLRDPSTGLKQRLDEQSPLPFHPIGMGDELRFFLARESGDHPLPNFRPFNRKCTSYLLGNVVRLVVGKVMLTPQFFCGVDDAPEALRRFRFCRFSTHKSVVSV